MVHSWPISKIRILLYKDEVYITVGYCFEVWNNLNYGFSEIVYKDAMELEFIKNNLPYSRETQLPVYYKGQKLNHSFKADFIVFDCVLVEVKCCESGIVGDFFQQVLNYLTITGLRVGLIVNFGKSKLEYKRIIK